MKSGIKRAAIWSYIKTEKIKNRYTFLDTPNLLDHYLLYNDQLLMGSYNIRLSDFLTENIQQLDLLTNYCEEFYKDIYKYVRKNGIDDNIENWKKFTMNS